MLPLLPCPPPPIHLPSPSIQHTVGTWVVFAKRMTGVDVEVDTPYLNGQSILAREDPLVGEASPGYSVPTWHSSCSRAAACKSELAIQLGMPCL